jgi:hypothetical protein
MPRLDVVSWVAGLDAGFESPLQAGGGFRRARGLSCRLLGAMNCGAALAYQMIAVFHLRQFQFGFGRLHPVLKYGRHTLALGEFEALLRNRDRKLYALCRHRRGNDKSKRGSPKAHFFSIKQ